MKQGEAILALSALSQETRMSVFRLLVPAGEKGLTVNTIADSLKVNLTTLSRHISRMMEADVLVKRREGRQIFYSVGYGQMRELLDFLMDDCCGNDPRICGCDS